MRTLLVSTLLTIGISVSWANEKLYNKLHKFYLSDRDKCMEKSKKAIAKNSSEAIPYYFTSVIYYDKSKESQTLRGTYLQLNRSIINAGKFEKYSGDQERDIVHWDEHIASLENRAGRLISALNKNSMNDLSIDLEKNLAKVTSLSEKYKPSENTDDILVKQIPENNQNSNDFIKVEGQFYGMPTGLENVESYNKNEELELLQLINNERTKRQLPVLTWNEDLAKASRYHAIDQGTQGYLNHSTKDLINGELVTVAGASARIRKFYKTGTSDGECIAAGNEDITATLNQWFKSESHKEIILDPSSKFIGIGFIKVEGSPYEYYWVLATGK